MKRPKQLPAVDRNSNKKAHLPPGAVGARPAQYLGGLSSYLASLSPYLASL